jgi:hypothetical protein
MTTTEAHEHVPFIDYENLPAPSEGIVVTQFITCEASLGPARSIPRSSAARW